MKYKLLVALAVTIAMLGTTQVSGAAIRPTQPCSWTDTCPPPTTTSPPTTTIPSDDGFCSVVDFPPDRPVITNVHHHLDDNFDGRFKLDVETNDYGDLIKTRIFVYENTRNAEGLILTQTRREGRFHNLSRFISSEDAYVEVWGKFEAADDHCVPGAGWHPILGYPDQVIG